MAMKCLNWWETWTPDLAYVLGFAFADGAIGRGRNSLVLSQSQRNLLDKISLRIPNGHLRYSEGAKVWCLRFCEPGLAHILAKFGIVPNKTKFGFYPDIPKSMIGHYLRGFFDGDGHVSIYGKSKSVVFVCHLEPYLEQVRDNFLALGATDGFLMRDGQNFRLRYHKSISLLRMYEIFYRDASLFCENKRATFDKVISYIQGSLGLRGSNHGNAKLTEASVVKIRRLWRTEKYTQIELGRMFSVNNRSISMIVNRQSWRHVE